MTSKVLVDQVLKQQKIANPCAHLFFTTLASVFVQLKARHEHCWMHDKRIFV